MSIESLSAELNNWYEKHCVNGNLSWNVLSRKTGITVSNITKIARGDVGKPKYETARTLLNAILPDRQDDIAEYIALTYQGGQITFSKEHESPRKQLTDDVLDLFRDPLTFRLFKLAMSGSRSVTSLEDDFGGSQVRPRLESLAQVGVVEVDEAGLLRRPTASQFSLSTVTAGVALEFKHAVDIVAEKKILANNGDTSIDKEANRLLAYHCSLTPESAQNMRREIVDFLRKTAQKYSAEEHKGEVELFYNVAIGRFDTQ